MKTTKVTWNVKKLARMYDNGTLNFDYPIQRKGNQWDVLQKSLLIHSISGDYPVPPVLLLNGEEVDYVLDGKQRITNIIDYISGVKDEEGNYPESAYPLHEETPNVKLDEIDEEFEIAGKYFDELHEDLQREILGINLSISRLEDATDEEIEELFYRWNNGTPLTKQQKARAKMGVGNATIIDSLVKHKFIQERALFTSLQRRRSDDEAVVLQTMMLLSGMEIESFVADKLLQYATDMRESDITPVTNDLKVALDYAYESGAESPLLKKLHLPTLLLVAKKSHDEGVSPQIFKAWVEDFNNAINGRTRDKALVKTNYKNYTGAGSVKRDKVIGRKNAMITHFNEFVDRYEPKVEEIKEEAKSEKIETSSENAVDVFTTGLKGDKIEIETDKGTQIAIEGLEEALSK